MLAKFLTLILVIALSVWNLINLLPGRESIIGFAMTGILAILGISVLCDMARTWIASRHPACMA